MGNIWWFSNIIRKTRTIVFVCHFTICELKNLGGPFCSSFLFWHTISRCCSLMIFQVFVEFGGRESSPKPLLRLQSQPLPEFSLAHFVFDYPVLEEEMYLHSITSRLDWIKMIWLVIYLLNPNLIKKTPTKASNGS